MLKLIKCLIKDSDHWCKTFRNCYPEKFIKLTKVLSTYDQRNNNCSKLNINASTFSKKYSVLITLNMLKIKTLSFTVTNLC